MQTVIETRDGWMIRCRNCQWHEFPKTGRPGASWSFNGDLDNPTFTPSMNECMNPTGSPHHNPEHPTRRCHFIVTNGQITYCGDCTHELKNKSFSLEAWDDAKVKYYRALKECEGW